MNYLISDQTKKKLVVFLCVFTIWYLYKSYSNSSDDKSDSDTFELNKANYLSYQKSTKENANKEPIYSRDYKKNKNNQDDLKNNNNDDDDLYTLE